MENDRTLCRAPACIEAQEAMIEKMGDLSSLCDEAVSLSSIIRDKLFGGHGCEKDGAGCEKTVPCVNTSIEALRDMLMQTCDNLNFLNQNI